jgi:putative endonuclease
VSRHHRARDFYVYIMSNVSKTLYTGVTNDLERRVLQHRRKDTNGFSARYNTTLLVYFESCGDVIAVIAREKQIKGWTRAKKVALIEAENPAWQDLAAEWFRWR